MGRRIARFTWSVSMLKENETPNVEMNGIHPYFIDPSLLATIIDTTTMAMGYNDTLRGCKGRGDGCKIYP
jgi:hypothetical protein